MKQGCKQNASRIQPRTIMLKSILIQIDDDLIQDCIGCYRSSKAGHFDRGLELPASFKEVMKISFQNISQG